MRLSDSLTEFFRTPDSNLFLNYIFRKLENVKILSLDVFDTVLMRDDKSELERFRCISEHFYKNALAPKNTNLTIDDCLLARVHAAKVAYYCGKMVDGCIEGQLSEIAEITLDYLRLPHDLAPDWVASELFIESQQLTPSPFVQAIIEKAKETGKRVICISDMYLNKNQISQLLNHSGATDKIEIIFSSADVILNKRSGLIFKHVENKLRHNGSDFLHIGDSLKSDYTMAMKSGWNAVHLPIPEKALQRRRKSHDELAQVLSLISKRSLPIAGGS